MIYLKNSNASLFTVKLGRLSEGWMKEMQYSSRLRRLDFFRATCEGLGSVSFKIMVAGESLV
jgi:hypothetical protein